MARHRFSGRLVLLLILLGFSVSSAPARGARWEPLPLWGGEVRLAAAADLSVVYAMAPSGGLFQSTDGGVTWQFITNGPSGPFDPILKVDPHARRRLYAKGHDAASFSAHLFRSEDGGRRWQRSDAGIAAETWMFDLAFHPETPGLLYAATSAGLYRSSDRGISWTLLSMAGVRLTKVAVAPSDPDVVLATAFLNDRDRTLRSTDGGLSFHEVLDLPQQIFLFDPTEPQRVFGSTFRGITRSDDLGATWIVHPFPWDLQTLAITPTGVLLSGGHASGVRRSEDGGITWVPDRRQSLPRDSTNTLIVLGDRVLAGGERGVWRGTVADLRWQESSLGVTAQSSVVLAVAGDAERTLWASTKAGLFVSRDGGATFEGRLAPLTPQGFVRLLALHPRQPDIAYAFGCCAPSTGLLKTEDAGESWRLLPYTGAQSGTVLEVDPRNPDVVYAGGPFFPEDAPCNALRSTDGGATWRCMAALRGRDLTDLAIDPRKPNNLFAMSGGRLYSSGNRGATWTLVPTALGGFGRIEVDPFRSERLYALEGGQLLRSDNGGRTWRQKLSAGLAPDTLMRDLILDLERRDRIWVTAESIEPGSPFPRSTSRVFRSDDAGEHWTEVSRGLKPGTVIVDLATDPFSADVIYAGTAGQGLFRLEK